MKATRVSGKERPCPSLGSRGDGPQTMSLSLIVVVRPPEVGVRRSSHAEMTCVTVLKATIQE